MKLSSQDLGEDLAYDLRTSNGQKWVSLPPARDFLVDEIEQPLGHPHGEPVLTFRLLMPRSFRSIHPPLPRGHVEYHSPKG